MTWIEHMTAMLGQQVKVTLDYDDPVGIVWGQLLSFSEDGEIVLLDEGGTKHWCWPNLKTELS